MGMVLGRKNSFILVDQIR